MKGAKLGVVVAGSFVGGVLLSALATVVVLIVYIGDFDQDHAIGRQYGDS